MIDFALISTFMLYSAFGATTRALFGIYKAYAKTMLYNISWKRVAVEIIASIFFGTFASLLLQEVGWLNVGIHIIALFSGFFGADLISLVSRKIGLTSSMKIELTEQNAEYAEFTERQVKGIEYLKKHGRITNDVYQKINGISHSSAKRDLAKLVKLGKIKKCGNGKSTYYKLS